MIFLYYYFQLLDLDKIINVDIILLKIEGSIVKYNVYNGY